LTLFELRWSEHTSTLMLASTNKPCLVALLFYVDSFLGIAALVKHLTNKNAGLERNPRNCQVAA
jgi:hypothetical protein